MKLIVMGVAGSGKSTLAAQIAAALCAPMVEGDDHHLEGSVAKMRGGVALDDGDREPWLDRLGDLLEGQLGNVVMTCSALKRRYRERLRAKVPRLRFVFIDISSAKASERVRSRSGHMFPFDLVASQFEALEPPLGETDVFFVPAAQPIPVQVDAVLRWLEAESDGRRGGGAATQSQQ